MNSELSPNSAKSDRKSENAMELGPRMPSLEGSLGEIAAAAGISLGVSVGNSGWLGNPNLSKIIREFSSITPASAMKISQVYPRRGEPNYAEFDAIADFARENGMRLRGHLCISRSNIPSWLFGLTRKQSSALVERYVSETIARHSDIVSDWDVGVELLDDEGGRRATLWSGLWGEGMFEVLFSWARQANPQAKLYYSDFNLHKTPKQQAVLRVIETLNRDRHLIDGVAMQCHHNIAGVLKLMTASEFLNELAARGLTATLSEITVWCSRPFPKMLEWRAQAAAYRKIFEFGTSHNVIDFCIWGTNDSTAWRHPKRTPFLFDSFCHPKPAYTAVRKFLQQRGRDFYFNDPSL